jgi:hypothetical protein
VWRTSVLIRPFRLLVKIRVDWANARDRKAIWHPAPSYFQAFDMCEVDSARETGLSECGLLDRNEAVRLFVETLDSLGSGPDTRIGHRFAPSASNLIHSTP